MPPHESILSDGLHRKEDQPPSRWPIVAVALLAVVAAIIWGFATLGVGEVEDQKNAAVAEKQDLGREVTEACAQGDVVQSPDGRDLCQRAAQVQAEPPPPITLPGAQGPTVEELNAAVAAYCAARNNCAGRPPNTAEVAAAVAQHLTANPPEPGRAPTPAEISSAVATWFTANPPQDGKDGADGRDGKDGADGKDGEPGPGPTDEQIDAAVAAWFAQNPPPPGPSCPDGTALEPVLFASGETGLGCVDDEQPDPDPPTSAAPTTEPDPEGLLGG